MSHTPFRVPLLVLALAAVPTAALDTPSLHNPTLLQSLQGSDAAHVVLELRGALLEHRDAGRLTLGTGHGVLSA